MRDVEEREDPSRDDNYNMTYFGKRFHVIRSYRLYVAGQYGDRIQGMR